MTDNKALIIAGVGAAMFYMMTKASAIQPTQGTLDIISCPIENISSLSGDDTIIPLTVKAQNGDVSKTVKISVGTYTDSVDVTLTKDNSKVITFTVPSTYTNTNATYNVSVI